MKIVFTDQALISINTAFDFLALQEIPREKIVVIFEKIFNRIEALAQMPYPGQREYLLLILTKHTDESSKVISKSFITSGTIQFMSPTSSTRAKIRIK